MQGLLTLLTSTAFLLLFSTSLQLEPKLSAKSLIYSKGGCPHRQLHRGWRLHRFAFGVPSGRLGGGAIAAGSRGQQRSDAEQWSLGKYEHLDNKKQHLPNFWQVCFFGSKDVPRWRRTTPFPFKFASFWGQTPLHSAANVGRSEVVRLLLSVRAAYVSTPDGLSPLHVAAHEGHLEVAKLLLADPPAHGERSVTPLHIAAHAGHLEMVRLLLKQTAGGADQRTPNRGATPLHAAAQEGRLEVAEFLLQNGSDHGKTTDTGCTALHVAAQKGHAKVVRLLLDHGADKNAKTFVGATALGLAARAGHLEVVRLLQPKRKRDSNGSEEHSQELQSFTRGSWISFAMILLYIEIMRFPDVSSTRLLDIGSLVRKCQEKCDEMIWNDGLSMS